MLGLFPAAGALPAAALPAAALPAALPFPFPLN